MSVARVTTVRKARKDQGKCGKCGAELPKGSAYRWWTVGFRSRYAHKRCLKPECSPRTSELESSKLAEVYAAIEAAQDDLAAQRNEAPGEQQEILDIISAAAEEFARVADEYREADEQIGGGGNTEMGERADALEESAGELEGFSPSSDPDDAEECADSEEEGHDADNCDACFENRQTLWHELIDEAEAALSEVSLS